MNSFKPETIDVRAEMIHVLVKITAKEIEFLKTAMNMCVGGPGNTPEEKEAWKYFVGPFWEYIVKTDTDLKA